MCNFHAYPTCDVSINPNCMPLGELPIPKILEDYIRTHLPVGYSGGGNCLSFTYNRAYFCVAETFEAPDGPELMLRWFSCKNTKRRGFEITEVMRKSPAEDLCYYRNMYYGTLAGWRTVYRDEAITTRGGYYGYGYTLWEKGWFNKWIPTPLKKAPGLWSKWINPEFVLTIPRYRYSGWSPKSDFPVIEYLQLYNINPGIEFFGKMDIMPTKAMIAKATKDGNFRRFIRDNAMHVRTYGGVITMHVYKHRGVSFEDAYEEINSKARATKRLYNDVPEAKTLPKSIDRRRIWDYAEHVGTRSYSDYLNAVKYLNLDVTDTKVLFPNEFKRMHDLRINEAEAARAKADAEKAATFAKKFAAAAVDYAFANYARPDDAYIVLIPIEQAQLVAEGAALSHCVGKMGYDSRMISHVSFIAFLRKADEVDKPFVTIEFNIEREKIVQIYGEHDQRPAEEVITWAGIWEKAVRNVFKKAKRALSQAARNGEPKQSIFEYIREAKLAA